MKTRLAIEKACKKRRELKELYSRRLDSKDYKDEEERQEIIEYINECVDTISALIWVLS